MEEAALILHSPKEAEKEGAVDGTTNLLAE